MDFPEAATFLFDLQRYPSRPGIESTQGLLSALDTPQDDLVFVQVAGSNGKGSTARMAEQVLRAAGLDVGLYTSPHIADVRERIRVNGRKIPQQSITAFVERVREYIVERATEDASPTFFEALTALACFEFDKRDVDVCVLEVGIGGRYDATSAVEPAASAVTSVSLEHTDVLGDSIAEIATDLAHVAPADRPLVTAATGAARTAIEAQAGSIHTVGGPDDAVRARYEGRAGIEGRIVLAGSDWECPTRLGLLGAHQARNAGVAVSLARQIGDELSVPISEAAIARGLRGTDWPGRFEVMDRSPLVVLDGAHNPDACETLANTLGSFEYESLTVVLGAMYDKDYAGMVEALPTPDRAIAARPPLQRAENEAALATVLERGGATDVRTADSIPDALDAAIEEAGPDDCVLVTGSIYTVAAARSRWHTTLQPTAIANREDATALLDRAGVDDAARRAVADDLVTHTLTLHATAQVATALCTAIERLGGTGVSSRFNAPDREHRTIVLDGTPTQLSALAERIENRDLPTIPVSIARELRARIDADCATGAGEGTDPWSDRTAVMGILNTTPDSFHDGGRYEAVEDAVARAEEMVEAGVDIIDVGGESTRPGADPVPIDEEIARVEPVIERISEFAPLVSIDTRKAAVGRAALEAGVDILNDVTGLADPEMRFLAAEYDCPIVLMHSIDAPVVPGKDVPYDDVVTDVISELEERLVLAEQAGILREKIIVDPGIGFGKRASESFELLGRIDEFHALGCPVLAGHSHKSMFDLVSNERLAATIAGSTIAAQRGADIVRVHDVAESVAAVRVAEAARNPTRFEDAHPN